MPRRQLTQMIGPVSQVGDDGPGAAVSDAEIVVEKMPDGELLVFENCGHMIMFEHPERFNRTVRDFLLG